MYFIVFILFTVPPVATLSIAGAILLITLICCCYCCCKLSSCNKKTEKDDESDIEEESFDIGTIELKEVPDHEKSQPSVDEMDYSVVGFFDEEEMEGTVLGKASQ